MVCFPSPHLLTQKESILKTGEARKIVLFPPFPSSSLPVPVMLATLAYCTLCCFPDDHARIKLKAESNPSRSDFINASPIVSDRQPDPHPLTPCRSPTAPLQEATYFFFCAFLLTPSTHRSFVSDTPQAPSASSAVLNVSGPSYVKQVICQSLPGGGGVFRWVQQAYLSAYAPLILPK